MATAITDNDVLKVLLDAKNATTQTVTVDGQEVTIRHPFESPVDWRDQWIYFLMLDRFNNPTTAPKTAWDHASMDRQGGTFEGVRQQLPYLQQLGVGAIWLSPILKNPKPEAGWCNYHGYQIQDFMHLDGRFATDGTRETAERQFIDLVNEAHARGIYIIVDIVLNHAARVFDYILADHTTTEFTDAVVLAAPLGKEPHIEWINGLGMPREDWVDNIPPNAELSDDDAVWPVDLQRKEFFRRRGKKLDDALTGAFVKGDFETFRQFVDEYDTAGSNEAEIRCKYGRYPVLDILVNTYQYMIARYDIDAFRIDTVKYVDPQMVEAFGNAIREYALSIGKRNFFTFGEIADNEAIVEQFVGRNTSEGFGIDAALDFPLVNILPSVVKGFTDVRVLRDMFTERKQAQKSRISSHGDSSRYFVTFLDNHDRYERFTTPTTPQAQVTQGIALLFTLQGIPCLYYGTEQGLNGAKDDYGQPIGGCFEAVREAMWGKANAFDSTYPVYTQIQALANLREIEPAIRYGRFYFREISMNGVDFGSASGKGGVIAFSRILVDREVLVVANTCTTNGFTGNVLVDIDLNRPEKPYKVVYSNLNGENRTAPVNIAGKRIYSSDGSWQYAELASAEVSLKPMEVQILLPS